MRFCLAKLEKWKKNCETASWAGNDLFAGLGWIYPWHSAGWITQFTDKVCAEHSQNYKGWVWVSVVFEGEATQQYYLCDLDDTMYGMDSHSSWCVLKRNQ